MMRLLLTLHNHLCLGFVRCLLRLALAIDTHRQWLPKRVKSWRGSLRRLYRVWLARHGLAEPPSFPCFRRAWNRTPDHVEVNIVRLHVEQPLLGAGQLRLLAARVLGFCATRETFRKILIRRRDLVTTFQQVRRKQPRRIRVRGPLQLWGADLTLVFLLGFVPVWIIGLVDYHGSRLIAFERLRWPTSAEITRVLEKTFREHGAPARFLTDRGPVFRTPLVAKLLAISGVRHVLTRPAHPWTNGRIERIFRTFKQTVFFHVWLLASFSQLDRFCWDFLHWYNRDRPHGAWNGRTPDEVFFGRPIQNRPLGRVSYFDGRLLWYRFG